MLENKLIKVAKRKIRNVVITHRAKHIEQNTKSKQRAKKKKETEQKNNKW